MAMQDIEVLGTETVKFTPCILNTDGIEYVRLPDQFKHLYYIKRGSTVYINLNYVED